MHVPRTLLATLAVAFLAGACSSGSGGPQAKPGVTGQHLLGDQVSLVVTKAERVSPSRALAPLDGVHRDKALGVVQHMFDATVVHSLTTGKGGDLEGIFTGDALERVDPVGSPDHAAVFDEGLPRVREVVADRADVRLTALDGDDGQPALVVARFDWDVRSGDGTVRIHRVGELTLEPGFGRWFVAGYTVLVSRTVGGVTTSATATSR